MADFSNFNSKRKVTILNLDGDMNLSSQRLEELRAGREIKEIPLNDEYWKALRKHRAAFNSLKENS